MFPKTVSGTSADRTRQHQTAARPTCALRSGSYCDVSHGHFVVAVEKDDRGLRSRAGTWSADPTLLDTIVRLPDARRDRQTVGVQED
jgi:hypothetical protein